MNSLGLTSPPPNSSKPIGTPFTWPWLWGTTAPKPSVTTETQLPQEFGFQFISRSAAGHRISPTSASQQQNTTLYVLIYKFRSGKDQDGYVSQSGNGKPVKTGLPLYRLILPLLLTAYWGLLGATARLIVAHLYARARSTKLREHLDVDSIYGQASSHMTCDDDKMKMMFCFKCIIIIREGCNTVASFS